MSKRILRTLVACAGLLTLVGCGGNPTEIIFLPQTTPSCSQHGCIGPGAPEVCLGENGVKQIYLCNPTGSGIFAQWNDQSSYVPGGLTVPFNGRPTLVAATVDSSTDRHILWSTSDGHHGETVFSPTYYVYINGVEKGLRSYLSLPTNGTTLTELKTDDGSPIWMFRADFNNTRASTAQPRVPFNKYQEKLGFVYDLCPSPCTTF